MYKVLERLERSEAGVVNQHDTVGAETTSKHGFTLFAIKSLIRSRQQKKLISGAFATIFVAVVSVLLFYGCKKEKDDPIISGKATSRYETVPYVKSAQKSGELDNLVFYDCDNEYNYYFFVLGHVNRVPLAYREAYYYNGVTSLTIKYSKSDITQESIKNSVTDARGYSITSSHSTTYGNEIGGKVSIGPKWLTFEASYKHSWGGSDGTSTTDSRSFSNTYETSLSSTSTTTTEESYVIGNKSEASGMYRWSLFSTTDVYCVVVTDRAKTKVIDAFISFCARPSQYWALDYEPEEGGSFGKTASGELLQIPEIILSQLPDPSVDPALPILTTNAVTVIATTTATLGGNITNVGTPAYTERGVCYATTSNPTIANNKTVVAGIGMGSFSTDISGLTPNTMYYVRAYAINTEGTAYGEQVSFTTTDEPKITYIDENGVAQTRLSASVTSITSSTTQMSGGWYYISGNVTVSSRITVSGEVHLILEDGCNLTVDKGINVPSGDKLTIYAQSKGGNMGKLKATGSNGGDGVGDTKGGIGGDAGIGGNGGAGAARNSKTSGNSGSNAGTITVNGGEVTATGGNGGNGSNGWAYGGGGAGAGIGGGGGGGGCTATGIGDNGESGGSGGSISGVIINGGTVIAWWGTAGNGGSVNGGNGTGGGGGRAAGIGGGGGGGGGGGYAAGGTGNKGGDGNTGDDIGSGGKGGNGGKGGTVIVGGTNGGSGGNGGSGSNILYDSRKLTSGSGHVKIEY